MRHIVTIGCVDDAALDRAASIWQPEKINGSFESGDVFLLLYDPQIETPAAFFEILAQIDAVAAPFGVIPISSCEDHPVDFSRLLGSESLDIKWSDSKFRLVGTASANTPDAPSILSRALHDDPSSVEDDITGAGFLFLQGHSGPVDGSYGKWLTLCSKPIHRSGEPIFFPCAGTDNCFRQRNQGRDATSQKGLIDIQNISASLLVLDGCGTLPIPGSIYCYEQSILRALMLSKIDISVLSIGVSATPFSVIVVFLATLALGATIGEAVREANNSRLASGSPSSLPGSAVGPWVVIGNPDMTVNGLVISEVVADIGPEDRVQLTLPPDDGAQDTGRLISIDNLPVEIDDWEIVNNPSYWVQGARYGLKTAFFWTGQTGSSADDKNADRTIILAPKKPQSHGSWASVYAWLQGGCRWLATLAETLAMRGMENQPIVELIAARREILPLVEMATSAVMASNKNEIVRNIEHSTDNLHALLDGLDRATAMMIASAIPHAGARLSHLWAPPWNHEGYAQVKTKCGCGCQLVGNVRRQAIDGLLRVELSCPACSLVGDVAAFASGDDPDTQTIYPTVEAALNLRSPTHGDQLQWKLERVAADGFSGYACATLFDPYGKRYQISDPVPVSARANAKISLELFEDWPIGLSWVTLAFASGGKISTFAFDIDIQRRAAYS